MFIVPTSWKRAGNSACPPTRAIATTPSSSGWRRASRTERGNSGSSSSSRTPRCASETSPGRGPDAATDHGRSRCAVMRRTKRRHGDQGTLRAAEARTPNGCGSPRAPPLGRAVGGFREACRASIVLPVPGGPVRRRLWSPAAATSSARRARSWPRTSARSGTAACSSASAKKRIERGSVDLASEICDDLAEMPNGDRLNSGERDFRGRFRGAEDALRARPPGALCDREGSGHRPHATVQRKLTDRRVLGEPLGGDLLVSLRGPQARSADRTQIPPSATPRARD